MKTYNANPTLKNLFFILFLVPFVLLLGCFALYEFVQRKIAGRKDQIDMRDYK